MNACECREYIDSAAFQEIAARLYGKENMDAARERWTNAVLEFVRIYGDNDKITLFSTPGRTEIGGNHTDHNNGRVLAAAVNLDTIAVAAPNDRGVVTLQSEGFPMDSLSLDLLSPFPRENHTSAALIRGVAARMDALGMNIGGFDAYTTTNVLKGSGLSSSAAFEVLIATIYDHFYNDGKLEPLAAAQIAQYAENVFFGKPCGLMDQTACAYGGFVAIDFADTARPVAEKVEFDFAKAGYALVITDTRGDHANLTPEYAAIREEMQAVAAAFGKTVLRECTREEILANAGTLRGKVGDRAILRALHFFDDNDRVGMQKAALERGDMDTFLALVNASGNSSWELLQNCFVAGTREQGVTLGLAVGRMVLGDAGACRVHGGGFAGTIQAFVPIEKTEAYRMAMDALFGKDSAKVLSIRSAGTIKIQ
ncbi:MAG: galactokinase family protein [Clostridiaceae bacterium]|nr:galactokinase family protein [Clostridiaceae bacterium]